MTPPSPKIFTGSRVRTLLAVLFTAGMGVLVMGFAGDVGFRRVSFTFWINFFVPFWTFAVQRLLRLSFGEGYYRLKPWERQGHFCVGLGVRGAKHLFSSRICRPFNPGFRLPAGERMLTELDRTQGRRKPATWWLLGGRPGSRCRPWHTPGGTRPDDCPCSTFS